MALSGDRIYVGFGFGPIQTGLFLYEAFKSGNFSRLIVIDVNTDLVSATRRAGGNVNINVAHADHLEVCKLTGITILNPAHPNDRKIIIDHVANSAEIGTAVPSVKHYSNETPGSIHRLLAQGFIQKANQGGPTCVVYAAENQINAAEILKREVDTQMPCDLPDKYPVQYLNTVIGKMGQTVNLSQHDSPHKLAPQVVDYPQAILVEAFNQIMISKITNRHSFSRGINVFQEKSDLKPFEELKLYGHNAVHAALGYLAVCLGVETISQLRNVPGLMAFVRSIFIDEIGVGLCRKFHQADFLFTKDGFNNYAEDLLRRMVNPLLMDSVSRITRDVNRKLGWEDRLIGTMRLCLEQGVEPNNFALAVAAAFYQASDRKMEHVPTILKQYREEWLRQTINPSSVDTVCEHINHGIDQLFQWQNSAFSPHKLISIAKVKRTVV
jgi:mannitol-1-phosphate 5-dehydrogenase